jgi:hypothetical protein
MIGDDFPELVGEFLRSAIWIVAATQEAT